MIIAFPERKASTLTFMSHLYKMTLAITLFIHKQEKDTINMYQMVLHFLFVSFGWGLITLIVHVTLNT